MNTAVTIFYILAAIWLVLLTIIAIVKKVKQKLSAKAVKKELDDEQKRDKVDESTKN